MGYTFKGDYNQLGAVAPDDTAQGNIVLDSLYKYMKQYGWKGTRASLLSAMALGTQGNYIAKLEPIVLDSFGFQMRILNLSQSKVDDAMKALASKSRGIAPTRQSVLNALGARAQQTDWGEAIKFTAVESAKQLTRGAQEIGKSVIATGKLATYLLPAIPIVLLLALYMSAKGRMDRVPLPKRLGGGQ